MIERRIKVYGDFACFTRPENKIDRCSYDVPTPSACRNILEAIYFKKTEFYYVITGITVLNPIQFIDIKKNEVNKKLSDKNLKSGIDVNQYRTQRSTCYLKDVAYLIDFRIELSKDFKPELSLKQREKIITRQLDNRIKNGKCFYQPYLGMRECTCYFEEPSGNEIPDVHVGSKELGLMLYDVFNPKTNGTLDTKNKKESTATVSLSYYYPIMRDGFIRVPEYDDIEVIKSEVKHV